MLFLKITYRMSLFCLILQEGRRDGREWEGRKRERDKDRGRQRDIERADRQRASA